MRGFDPSTSIGSASSHQHTCEIGDFLIKLVLGTEQYGKEKAKLILKVFVVFPPSFVFLGGMR